MPEASLIIGTTGLLTGMLSYTNVFISIPVPRLHAGLMKWQQITKRRMLFVFNGRVSIMSMGKDNYYCALVIIYAASFLNRMATKEQGKILSCYMHAPNSPRR